MSALNITQVVRSIVGKEKTIINEGLADGRRSLKVWGYKSQDYKPVIHALEAAGCYVVLIRQRRCGTTTAPRIWIKVPR